MVSTRVTYIIPLVGTGNRDDPFRPMYLESPPPFIHYNIPKIQVEFSPDFAIQQTEMIEDENTVVSFTTLINEATEELEKLAENGVVKKVEEEVD